MIIQTCDEFLSTVKLYSLLNDVHSNVVRYRWGCGFAQIKAH